MTFRDRPSDRDDTEAVRAGADPLARLLAAASAPGHPAELTGEQVAVAAFRSASGAGVAPGGAATRPVATRPRVLTRVLAVKLAAAAAATAAASVAFAAGTGIIPNPIRARTVVPTASATPALPPAATSGHPASGSVVPGSGATRTVPRGLCQAYFAWKLQGKNLYRPAFERLVTEAGSEAGVDAYCTKLLAPPTDEPGQPSPGQGQPSPGQGQGNPSPGEGNRPSASPPGHVRRG